MERVNQEMTVSEALQFCSPAQQINLQYWANSFGVKLGEFHLGHIKTYESERLREASLQMVNAEVSTLLSLLDSVEVGDEIRERYQPLREPDELSSEEKASLPERAHKYIEKLESELQSITDEKHRIGDRLRKANWVTWRS